MPYLGSTVFIVTMVAGFAVAMIAYWLALRSLASGFVARAEKNWRERSVTTVLLGAVTGGSLTLLTVLLFSVGHPALSFLATVLLTAITSVALAGAAGLAGAIGSGLASPSDEGREWFRCLKGGAVLELTFLLPVVGWLVFLPVALYGGFGAALRALVQPLFNRLKSAMTVDARAA